MDESGAEVLASAEGKPQSKTYEVDSTPITVNFVGFEPQGEKDPDKTILFLPGWSMDAGSQSTNIVGKAFAEESSAETLVIDTTPKGVTKDSLYKEAAAISKLLKERRIKNVVIAGHSEGGIKAADLAAILQKQRDSGESDINVEGIILMESMGLFKQENPAVFTGKFLKNGVIDAQAQTFKGVVSDREGISQTERRSLGMALDVILGTLKDLAKANIHYPQKLLSQISEMRSVDPRLGEIKVPVILIHGKNDLISSPEKVLPEYEKTDDREKLLRESLFPNSPYVRMVTGERLGTHGMPIYRAEQVAKTSLYLLDRYKRQVSTVPASVQASFEAKV